MAAAAHVDRLFVALVALDAVEAEAVVHVRVWRLGVAAGVDLFGDGVERDVAGKALLNVMKSGYAYDGNAYGGGLSYGYQLYLSPHWNIEFTAGVGYVRFKYDKTPFPASEAAAGSYRNDYFGPTKLGISIMYIIK